MMKLVINNNKLPPLLSDCSPSLKVTGNKKS